MIQVNAFIGIIVTLLLAIYAFKKEQLTEGGTIAAMIVGMTVFAFGGWPWLALLAVFFVSSSFWGKYKEKEKEEEASEYAKTGVRDFWQVMANGLVPAALAAVYYLDPSPAIAAAFVAAVATVTADTWATELGVFDKNPVLVTTLKKARPGVSGGVSLLGFAAVIAASLLVVASYMVLAAVNNGLFAGEFMEDFFVKQFAGGGLLFAARIAVAGFAGALADSVLGATLQGGYHCRNCGKETEKTLHKCGHKTELVKGYAVVDNDAVNFLSAIAGAGLGWWLAILFL